MQYILQDNYETTVDAAWFPVPGESPPALHSAAGVAKTRKETFRDVLLKI